MRTCQSVRGDADFMWMAIGGTVCVVALIVSMAFTQVSEVQRPNWQLEAIQYGYGRMMDGKFQWVPPEEWVETTRQQVDRRVEALVPEEAP